MTDIRLSDEVWDKMRDFLRQESRSSVGRDEHTRHQFVEEVQLMTVAGPNKPDQPD